MINKDEEYYIIKHPFAKSELEELLKSVNAKINDCIIDLQNLEVGLADKDYEKAKRKIAFLDNLVDTAHAISQILADAADIEDEINKDGRV